MCRLQQTMLFPFTGARRLCAATAAQSTRAATSSSPATACSARPRAVPSATMRLARQSTSTHAAHGSALRGQSRTRKPSEPRSAWTAARSPRNARHGCCCATTAPSAAANKRSSNNYKSLVSADSSAPATPRRAPRCGPPDEAPRLAPPWARARRSAALPRPSAHSVSPRARRCYQMHALANAFEERGSVFLARISAPMQNACSLCLRRWRRIWLCTVQQKRHMCVCVALLESA